MKITLTIIFVIFLVSCAPMANPTPTETLIPTTTITPVPLSPTSTPKPTVTSTPAPTLTLAPIPTLENSLKLKLIEDLLANNKNCKLPCWWGITPGRTEWQVGERFLATFASIHSFQLEEENHHRHVVIFSVSKDIDSTETLWHRYTDHNGVIESIEIETGRTSVYSLPNVLTNYGQPDEIWIRWINTKPNHNGYFPMFLFVFYKNKGILLEYATGNLDVTEISVIGCPQEDVSPEMFLWSPKFVTGKSLDEILNQTDFFYGKGRQYLPLTKSTNMNVEEFYSVFKNADNSTCIETPINLWEKGANPFP